MKKIVITIILLAITFSFASCGDNSNNQSSETTLKTSSVSTEKDAAQATVATQTAKTLDGLISYLQGKGLINEEKEQMSADLVGAKTGYKFHTSKGDVELYYYDISNLTSAQKTIINTIKSSGTIDMSGITITITAYKEPFLLICDDCSNESAIKEVFNAY
ncbi:MAG: hypothetical protein Q8876_06475 [Bacillota bacterium]|nr:hypothetical protein [Bacillota bacterium]